MWALLASFLAIAFSGCFPEEAVSVACPLFMASVLILGMPHGTIDPLLLFSKVRSERWLSLSSRAPWIVAYLSVAAAYGVLWFFFPLYSTFIFLLLTIFHWGTSEYVPQRYGKSRWLLLGLSRGGLVILGVFAFQFQGAQEVIRVVSGVEPLLFSSATFKVLLVVTGLVHVALLLWSHRHELKNAALRIGDSFLILLMLAHTPALLGITIYYTVFHAWRSYEFFGAEKSSLFWVSHLLCFIVAIWLLAKSSFPEGLNELSWTWLPGHFVILAALTLPHAVLMIRLQFLLPSHEFRS